MIEKIGDIELTDDGNKRATVFPVIGTVVPYS